MNDSLDSNGKLATSRWMKPDETENRFALDINENDRPTREGSLWFGRNVFEGASPIGLSDDRHMLVVGGTRGGKGVSTIVPNICLWSGSMIVIDPKGENATLTAARRGHGSENCDGLGQSVHVLDPMRVAKVDDGYRATYNPLDALDPASSECFDNAVRIADALVDVGTGEDRYWNEGGRIFILSLILHVLTHPKFEGERNLITVRRLIQAGDEETLNDLKQKNPGLNMTSQVAMWALASKNDQLNGVIATNAKSLLQSAKNAPKQYEGYRGRAANVTEFIDSQGMAECLRGSSFDLTSLKTDPDGVSVFLSLPSRFMGTHFRWLRMMISLTLTQMEALPGKAAREEGLIMVLDEFAGMRRMEIIENSVAQIAGFGVKMMFVLQSLEQLKSVYPDRWETFIANCGAKIFFSTGDNFTNDYVSKTLGEQEVVVEIETSGESTADTRSRAETSGESSTISKSKTDTQSQGTHQSRGQGTTSSAGGSSSASWGTGRSRSRTLSFTPEFMFSERVGRNRNNGRSKNKGGSETNSWSTSKGKTWTNGDSRTQARAETISNGQTYQNSSTRGSSQTTGTNHTVTYQKQRRPLLTPNEMDKLFARLDDDSHPAFPGLALVQLSGENPIVLRRTPYYLDPAFTRCFDPHPDHPFIAPRKDADEKIYAERRRHSKGKSVDASRKGYWLLTPEDHKLFDSCDLPEYESNHLVPLPISFLWYILTRADLYNLWLTPNSQCIDLTDPFGTGTSFSGGVVTKAWDNGEGQAKTIALLLYGIHPQYIEFRIDPAGSNFSDLKIWERFPKSKNPVVRSLFSVASAVLPSFRNLVEADRSDRIRLNRNIVTRLCNFGTDMFERGYPEKDYTLMPNDHGEWFFLSAFNKLECKIHYAQDGQFGPIEVGLEIDPRGLPYDRYKIASINEHSVYITQRCRIAEILKGEGELVEPCERYLRVELL